MLDVILPGAAITAYASAALVVLRLIPRSGRKMPWLLVVGGLVLLATDSAFALAGSLSAGSPPDLLGDLVDLAASMLVLAGAVATHSVFDALERSTHLKARFGRLLATSLNEIYVFEADSLRFEEVNHGARLNLGYTDAELRELTPLDLKPEFDEASFRSLIGSLRRGEVDRLRFSTRHRRKDGSEYPVDVDLQLASEGRRPAFIAVVHDVTERVRTERELERSQANLHSVLDHAPVILWAVDAEGVFTLSEGSGLWSLGLAPGQVVGESLFELFKSQESILSSVRAALRGESLRGRFEVGGNTFATVQQPLRDADGNIVGAIGVATDVTESSRAERALAESESHFRSVIEHAQDIITVLDQTGVVRYQSPSLERILGIPAQERIGRSSLDLIHPEDAGRAMAALKAVLTGADSPRSVVYRLRHRDGSWRTFEAVGSVRTVGDGPPEVVVNQRDITERERDRQERERAEAQLRHAQKMETIGTLAGGIAHDFNNLLTPILGYSQILREDVPESLTRDVDEIVLAARRAQELVRQILTFSRQSEPVRRTVDLAEVVEEALRLMRATVPATVAIEKEIQPGIGRVSADPTQVHQVLMNLCTNAHQAMRPAGGILRVEVAQESLEGQGWDYPSLGDGPHVRITVSDTGHGMDAGTLERIFEPFFTTKAVGEGTGLGLSVAHGIMVEHGGALTAESEAGAGTRFHAWFPVIAEAAQARSEETGFDGAGGERILLLDDQEAVAELTERMLVRLGYRVVVSTGPRETLTRIRNAPRDVDLVLTDQTMPGMTGLELAAELRSIRKDLPVVIMSGFSDVHSAGNLDELGIRGFLQKPFGPGELGRTLREALDGAAVA